jgi:hypothetical protein
MRVFDTEALVVQGRMAASFAEQPARARRGWWATHGPSHAFLKFLSPFISTNCHANGVQHSLGASAEHDRCVRATEA